MTSDRRSRPVALLFTQQLVGLSSRKTGMVYWAEAFARAGWDTHAVTVQLSWLSRLRGQQRLAAVPEADVNQWRSRSETLNTFVWVPAVHPASFGIGPIDTALGPVLARAYAAQLPASVRERAAAADIIVIESCAAVALFPRLKPIAPRAKFVYCASDRLESVGMHPVLTKILQRTAKDYDLIRVPAASMLADFGDDVRAMHIPHGIDRSAFANAGGNPYKPGTRNAVVAGDMMFDHDVMAVLIERFPDVTFHAFGRMEWKASAGAANLHHHGEVPFGTLVPYLVHADVGIAPYTFRPDLAYLSESSLKLIQYSYCRLPVVAPFFAKGSRSNIFDYVPEDAETAVAAFRQALVLDKGQLEPGSVKDWDEVVSEVIRCATIRGAKTPTSVDLTTR